MATGTVTGSKYLLRHGGLSAHADYNGILEWLGGFRQGPRRTFITHGEPAAADELRRRIGESLGWHCSIPGYMDREGLS